jgi:hypothetical protein
MYIKGFPRTENYLAHQLAKLMCKMYHRLAVATVQCTYSNCILYKIHIVLLHLLHIRCYIISYNSPLRMARKAFSLNNRQICLGEKKS